MKKERLNKEKNHSKKNPKEVIKYIWRVFWRPEMAILPGQLAFFIILSLVPIITLVVYGASFFDLSIEPIKALLETNLNPTIANMLIPIISGEPISISLLIMFIFMFYIASNGAASIIVTSNTVYNIPQKPWLKRRLKAIFITFILVTLYLFVLFVPAFAYQIIEAIDAFNIRPFIFNIITIMQGPITWIIIFIFIKIIYTVAPDLPILSKHMNLGAIFTTTGWVLISALYGIYVREFANHDLFYRDLSNLAILMLWIYFLSVIFIIGININHRTLEKMEIIGTNKNTDQKS